MLLPTFIIESPLQTQADLFLDVASTGHLFGTTLPNKNGHFRTILNNTIQGKNEIEKRPALGQGEAEQVHQSPIKAIRDQVEALGLPLNNIVMDPKDLPLLKKVLTESELDKDTIDQIMKRLMAGPLTMDRIMAIIGSSLNESQSCLVLSDSSLPVFGRFLTELGLNPDQVKEIISDLGQSDKFGTETLRNLLLKYGQTSLKDLNLSNVDLENVKELLTSLGIQSKDLENLWAQLEASNGRMSMERFLSFLDSLVRPAPLKPEQMNYISTLVRNLRLKNTFRIQPQFNRIVSLIQSMGSKQVDPESLIRNNPAVAILREGTVSARNILNQSEFYGAPFNQKSSLNFDLGKGASNEGMTSNEGGFPINSEMRAGLSTTRSSFLSESILKQISEGITYSLRNNLHRIRFQLHPPELGQIKINITFKDNQLHARIVAENGMVKQELEQNQEQLRKILEGQGINLERFDVLYDRGERDFSGEPEGWNVFQDRSQTFSDTESIADSLLAEELPAVLPAKLNEGEVDLFA